MSSPLDLLEAAIRRAPNPFEDRVLRSGHEAASLDVPEVLSDAFEKILLLLERARTDRRSRIHVVAGDPGDGKTHLLSRLRRHAEQSFRVRTDVPFGAGIVRPLRDPSQPFIHILREAASSLDRPLPFVDPDGDQPASQLERLAWIALGRAVHHLSGRDPSLADLRGDQAAHNIAMFVNDLSDTWPERGEQILADAALWAEREGIDPDTFRVLGRLPVPGARRAALSWLKGIELPEADADRFGLPEPVADEERAYRVLTSLANLGDGPLVLGFDQIEGVRRRGIEPVQQLFAALSELYNHEPGRFVLAVFCQTTIWKEIHGVLEQQILDRLDLPQLLRPLYADEVRALCKARLSALWNGEGLTPPHPLYPFAPDEIAGLGTLSARKALEALAARFDERCAAPHAPPKSPVVALHDEALARATAEIEDQTPEQRAAMSRNVVRRVLEGARGRGRRIAGTVVSAVETVSLGGLAESGTRITLGRGDQQRRLYFEANGSAHGKSMAVTLRRLDQEVRARTSEVAVLLREKSYPLPPTAQQILDQAGKVFVLWLDRDELPPLAAVEAFLNDAAEHEIPDADALDFATEKGAALPLMGRLVDLAFEAAPPSAPRRAAPDPALAERVLGYLRDTRSIVGLPQLADALGAPGASLAAVCDQLAVEGRISMATDREQVGVVVRRV